LVELCDKSGVETDNNVKEKRKGRRKEKREEEKIERNNRRKRDKARIAGK
jgi:hypothetical protein